MKQTFLAIGSTILLLANMTVWAQTTNTQAFTTEDETFSFDYPAGWSVEIVNADYGPNASLAVNNVSGEDRFFSSESVLLQIWLPNKFYAMGFQSGETPAEMVANNIHGTAQPATIDFATPSPGGTPQPLQVQPAVPDVNEFMVDGRPAAYGYDVLYTMGIESSRLIIVADLGDDYWVSLYATSLTGGLETLRSYEPTILQIVKSMRYTPPAPVYSSNPDLPLVFSGSVGVWRLGSIRFFYPANWYISTPISVVITNTQRSVVNVFPESGQFIASITGVSETIASVDSTELFNKCNVHSRNWTAREIVAELLSGITPAQLEQMERQGITYTQPEVVTVNDVEIVYIRQYQDDFEVLSAYIDLGEGDVISMAVTTRQGEMAQFENQLFAVASTIEYTPAPCTDDEAATAQPGSDV